MKWNVISEAIKGEGEGRIYSILGKGIVKNLYKDLKK
jgi:hypothetical protein